MHRDGLGMRVCVDGDRRLCDHLAMCGESSLGDALVELWGGAVSTRVIDSEAERTSGRVDEWKSGRVDEWTGGRVDGRTGVYKCLLSLLTSLFFLTYLPTLPSFIPIQNPKPAR